MLRMDGHGRATAALQSVRLQSVPVWLCGAYQSLQVRPGLHETSHTCRRATYPEKQSLPRIPHCIPIFIYELLLNKYPFLPPYFKTH